MVCIIFFNVISKQQLKSSLGTNAMKQARAKIEAERFVTLFHLQEEGMADGFLVHWPVILSLGVCGIHQETLENS